MQDQEAYHAEKTAILKVAGDAIIRLWLEGNLTDDEVACLCFIAGLDVNKIIGGEK